VIMQKALRDFIADYNQQFGSTIILTSHYMDDVKQLCERAIIIDSGSKIYDGSLQNIIEKYARNKKLSLVFNKEVSKAQLDKFGEVKELLQDGSSLTATLLVPRQKAT